jgi:hypothetical protein
VQLFADCYTFWVMFWRKRSGPDGGGLWIFFYTWATTRLRLLGDARQGNRLAGLLGVAEGFL